MRIIERKVQEIGKSLLITLPKDWATILNIIKGTKLKLLISDNAELTITPEFVVNAEKQSKSIINYDKDFIRRFFREYFQPSDEIIINIKDKISESERKELYLFLKRFMNAQIMEETKTKIKVKCFKIEDLTMNECLQRMHYLSLNIYHEKIEDNNQSKIEELTKNMTRFYYMLVMQIRRFLSEGKYIKDKSITLVRSMDIRMVAEKMQRITQNIVQLDNNAEEPIQDILNQLIEYYKKAFSYFFNNEFEKSVKLWSESKTISNKIKIIENNSKKNKNFNLYKQTTHVHSILRYAKEISMLLR